MWTFPVPAGPHGDGSAAASHQVIDRRIAAFRQDYRWEVGTNPVPALRNRIVGNTRVGRVPGAAQQEASLSAARSLTMNGRLPESSKKAASATQIPLNQIKQPPGLNKRNILTVICLLDQDVLHGDAQEFA